LNENKGLLGSGPGWEMQFSRWRFPAPFSSLLLNSLVFRFMAYLVLIKNLLQVRRTNKTHTYYFHLKYNNKKKYPQHSEGNLRSFNKTH
jgi:hypothetical protein